MSIIVCLEFVVSPVVGLLEIFRFVLIFRKVFAEEGKHNYEPRGLQEGFKVDDSNHGLRYDLPNSIVQTGMAGC